MYTIYFRVCEAEFRLLYYILWAVGVRLLICLPLLVQSLIMEAHHKQKIWEPTFVSG